jgi:hypothetical protein
MSSSHTIAAILIFLKAQPRIKLCNNLSAFIATKTVTRAELMFAPLRSNRFRTELAVVKYGTGPIFFRYELPNILCGFVAKCLTHNVTYSSRKIKRTFISVVLWLSQLPNHLPHDLKSGFRTVVALLGRREFLRQVGTAQTNGIELEINDGSGAEVVPVPSAANTVNKALNCVGHFAA